MKHILNIPVPIAVFGVIFLTPALYAQEEPTTPKPVSQASSSDYCSLSKVLGAKVRMNPGAEARREAEKEGEAAKRPSGKVDDVLVDCGNGSLQYAVISFGGFVGIGDKTVAVPFSALTWDAAQERYDLAASEDRLKSLPAFDLGKARKTGLDAAGETIHMQWGATPDQVAKTPPEPVEPKDASAKKETRMLAGSSFYVIPTRLVCASEIDDFPVYATNEKFGKITDTLVDRNQRNVALIVVKRGGALGLGGTEYLVPFRALYFCTSGEERVHCINADAAKLETAVVYEKPKNGIVDAEAAKRALAGTTFDKSDRDYHHDKADKGR